MSAPTTLRTYKSPAAELGHRPSASFGDLESEKIVLGWLCAGHGMSAIRNACPRVGAHLFPNLGPAIEAALELERAGRNINGITLTESLGHSGNLDAIGGASVLVPVDCVSSPGKAADAILESSLNRLCSLFEKRSVAKLGAEMTKGMAPTEALARIKQIEELSAKHGGLTFRTVSEILKMTFDAGDLYLGNGYLQKGGSLAILGSGGVGKSRLVMQLAICLAAGLPFCGWETRGKPKTLFLQTENGNRRLHYDLSRMTSELGDEGIAILDQKLIFHTLETSLDVFLRPSNPTAQNRMVEAMRQHDPDIVVVDVLRDFAIGDINTDEGMTDTLDALTQIIRNDRPDRAIIVLHHARTGKKAAIEAHGLDRSNFGRNSKVLYGWARAVLNLAPLSEEDTELIGMVSGKNNDFREVDPIALRLDPECMIYRPDKSVDISAKVSALNDTGKKPSSVTVEDVLEIVEGQEGMSRRELCNQLMARDCGRSKAYELIAQAERKSIKFSSKNRGFVSTRKNTDLLDHEN